jgi:hypothetical protein
VHSKSEDPALREAEGVYQAGFDYVVTDNVERFVKSDEEGRRRWKMVAWLEGLQGVRKGGKYGVEVVWGSKAAVLRRI